MRTASAILPREEPHAQMEDARCRDRARRVTARTVAVPCPDKAQQAAAQTETALCHRTHSTTFEEAKQTRRFLRSNLFVSYFPIVCLKCLL